MALATGSIPLAASAGPGGALAMPRAPPRAPPKAPSASGLVMKNNLVSDEMNKKALKERILHLDTLTGELSVSVHEQISILPNLDVSSLVISKSEASLKALRKYLAKPNTTNGASVCSHCFLDSAGNDVYKIGNPIVALALLSKDDLDQISTEKDVLPFEVVDGDAVVVTLTDDLTIAAEQVLALFLLKARQKATELEMKKKSKEVVLYDYTMKISVPSSCLSSNLIQSLSKIKVNEKNVVPRELFWMASTCSPITSELGNLVIKAAQDLLKKSSGSFGGKKKEEDDIMTTKSICPVFLVIIKSFNGFEVHAVQVSKPVADQHSPFRNYSTLASKFIIRKDDDDEATKKKALHEAVAQFLVDFKKNAPPKSNTSISGVLTESDELAELCEGCKELDNTALVTVEQNLGGTHLGREIKTKSNVYAPVTLIVKNSESKEIISKEIIMDRDRILPSNYVKEFLAEEYDEKEIEIEVLQYCNILQRDISAGKMKPLMKDDVPCMKGTLTFALSAKNSFSWTLSDQETAKEKKKNTFVRYLVISLVVGYCVFFLSKSFFDERRFDSDVEKLLAYYSNVVPGSMAANDKHNARWLVYKYRNKKNKLWKTLEKKYGEPVREVWEWPEKEEEELVDLDGNISTDEASSERSSEGENNKSDEEL